MESIFDFAKMYAGVASLNGETYPCTLSFPDAKINFKLIGKPVNQHVQLKLDFTGYVSTEQGIMNYRAINSLQTYWSSGSFDLSHQEFQADQLLVGNLSSDMDSELFEQVNICYNNLESIGNFITFEQDSQDNLNFSFKKYFDAIILNEDSWGSLTLENPVRYNFRNSELQYFNLNIDPFFSFVPKEKISLAEVQYLSYRLGWFIQLLFDIRQEPIDVVLFKKPVSLAKNPFYYLAPELIRRKTRKTPISRRPTLELNQLSDDIKNCFVHWNKFNNKQLRLATLYFKEINTQEYIIDDRFKNMCSIIQGLEILGTSNKIASIRGEMNSKLRRASTLELEEILSSYINVAFLYKLYEIIGHQRDHFQHLSKNLDYDLSDNVEEFATVNALLTVIIRYHFLLAISLSVDGISKIINGEMIWISHQLRKLKNNIQRKFPLS